MPDEQSASGSPSPSRKRLPAKPSAEHLTKQAKRRVRANTPLTLTDAQHALAQEYGCRNWAELMQVVETMSRGEDQLAGGSGKVEPLPAAVRARDVAKVREILASGQYTPHDLDAGLAHAAWYGGDALDVLATRKLLFDLLLDHGADPDGQYGSAYGPIVFGTGECQSPEGLQWLIDAGADVTFPPTDTKYGKQCPLSYWLGSYGRGDNSRKHRGIEMLLKHGPFVPPEVTPEILAIHRGDTKTLAALINANPSLVQRRYADMPYGNIGLAGATLLHCAVEFGEMECIDLLLARGADINAKADIIDGIGGQTPIFHAVATLFGGVAPTLRQLLRRSDLDANVRATFVRFGEKQTEALTPLECAINASGPETPQWRATSIEEITMLLDAGADPNARVADGKTPLHRAVMQNRADIIEVLLSRGARNWIEDAAGKKPVHCVKADDSDDARKIRSLLSEIRILNPHFRDAVSAIDAGDVTRLKQILREHPNLVHERAEEEGWFAGPYFRHPTLLHFVANNPNRSPHMPPNILDTTRAILDAGAQVDAVTESDNGGSTLALVATSGPASRDGLQIPLIELLVSRGADPNNGLDGAMIHHELKAVETMLRLGAKHTLSTAAGMGEVDVLLLLLQSRPDEKQRLAAAQVAATLGKIETLQILLDTGLDVNARLPHPFSPTLLHQAAWYGHAALVDALLARGADPKLRDTQYNGTPADWARVNKHPELAAKIEEKGNQ